MDRSGAAPPSEGSQPLGLLSAVGILVLIVGTPTALFVGLWFGQPPGVALHLPGRQVVDLPAGRQAVWIRPGPVAASAVTVVDAAGRALPLTAACTHATETDHGGEEDLTFRCAAEFLVHSAGSYTVTVAADGEEGRVAPPRSWWRQTWPFLLVIGSVPGGLAMAFGLFRWGRGASDG